MTTQTDTLAPQTGALHPNDWPTCPKDGDPVAAGKNGQPLRACEKHSDRRPSSAARAAAKAAAPFSPAEKAAYDASADAALATVRFGAARPAPKPSKREKDNAAIKARLAAKPGQHTGVEAEVLPPVETGPVAVVEAVTGEPITPDKIDVSGIPVRLHKKHGFLATVKLPDGKTLYRYGNTAEAARARMAEALEAR